MTTKVMLSIPEEFLAEVDELAQKEHRSRSELIREALRLYLGMGGSGKYGAASAHLRAVQVQDELARYSPGTGEDSTADVRRWRKARS